MLEKERVAALSKLAPTSPRIYQFEPISTAGLSAGALIGGAAVPNRSAAYVGVDASARPARAAAANVFIGSILIAALDAHVERPERISPRNINLDLTLTVCARTFRSASIC